MTRGVAWVRRAEKTDIETGSWNKGKKMPKTAFPLRPSHAYQLAGTWNWRLMSFTAEGERYKVLLAYKEEKQEFLAMLGKLNDREITVLCRVEHHGTHPGWHVHYQPFLEKQSGVVRGADEIRRPCGEGSRFGTEVVSGFDDWAISVAHGLFNMPHAGFEDSGSLL